MCVTKQQNLQLLNYEQVAKCALFLYVVQFNKMLN